MNKPTIKKIISGIFTTIVAIIIVAIMLLMGGVLHFNATGSTPGLNPGTQQESEKPAPGTWQPPKGW